MGDKSMAFWKSLFADAKSGAFLLLVDSDSASYEAFFKAITEGMGWQPVVAKKTKRTLTWSEDKTDLKEFLTKFGRVPRVKGSLDIRLLKKP